MEERCSKEEAREVFENDPETVSVCVALDLLGLHAGQHHTFLCCSSLKRCSVSQTHPDSSDQS